MSDRVNVIPCRNVFQQEKLCQARGTKLPTVKNTRFLMAGGISDILFAKIIWLMKQDRGPST